MDRYILAARSLNEAAGRFFFARDTMRFFRCRLMRGYPSETRTKRKTVLPLTDFGIHGSPRYLYIAASDKRCFDDYGRRYYVVRVDTVTGEAEKVDRTGQPCFDLAQADMGNRKAAHAMASKLAWGH